MKKNKKIYQLKYKFLLDDILINNFKMYHISSYHSATQLKWGDEYKV